MNIDIKTAGISNFTRGREGDQVEHVIIKPFFASKDESFVNTTAIMQKMMQRPEIKTSYHYGIDMFNNVGQFVDEGDTAWSTGLSKYNRTSVSILVWDGYHKRFAKNRLHIPADEIQKGLKVERIDKAVLETLIDLCVLVCNNQHLEASAIKSVSEINHETVQKLYSIEGFPWFNLDLKLDYIRESVDKRLLWKYE